MQTACLGDTETGTCSAAKGGMKHWTKGRMAAGASSPPMFDRIRKRQKRAALEYLVILSPFCVS